MDKEDHDLLVKLTTKMDQLCKTNKTVNEGNEKAHNAILNQIDKNHEKSDKWISAVHDRIDNQLLEKTNQVAICHKTFLQSKIFYWVVGFIIAGLVSAWGTISLFDTRVDKVEARTDKVEVIVEKHHPEDLKLH